MQIESPVLENFSCSNDTIPLKLRYESFNISNQHLLDKIGSVNVVFKDYILIFQGESDDSQSNKIFYTFNMNSHELKEGKLQGKIPERILDNGACMYDENTILMIGNSKGSAQDLFLLTITEGIELSIKSEMWLKDKKKEVFNNIYSFYKYNNEFYVFGIRTDLESSKIFEGLWKLNKSRFSFLVLVSQKIENGKWEMNQEVNEEKSKRDYN